MMATDRRARRGIVWAVVGGVVLIAGLAAVIIAALISSPTTAPPTPSSSSAPGEPSPSGSSVDVAVVDETVVGRGWAPEPITTNPDEYARAALAAASTFDTTLSSRSDWLAFLDSWFTVDTRYSSEFDQARRKEAAQLELRQGIVLPEAEWDSLAAEDGRVVAAVDGEVTLEPVPDDTSGDMRIATADVVLTFTRADGAGNESSYDEMVRVSVQVLCGPESVPASGSAQQAGDCKVVRYFTEPMEP